MKFFKLHLLIGNQEVQKLNTRSRFHSLYLQKCKHVAFEFFAGQAIRLEKLFLSLKWARLSDVDKVEIPHPTRPVNGQIPHSPGTSDGQMPGGSNWSAHNCDRLWMSLN